MGNITSIYDDEHDEHNKNKKSNNNGYDSNNESDVNADNDNYWTMKMLTIDEFKC